MFPERLQKTEDGYELTWAVNVMAPFLLTGLLLDTVTVSTGVLPPSHLRLLCMPVAGLCHGDYCHCHCHVGVEACW